MTGKRRSKRKGPTDATKASSKLAAMYAAAEKVKKAAAFTKTIANLEESNSRQIAQIGDLTVKANEWERQAKEAQQIFKDHNFTKLSRLRPGMIEDRANNKTAEVFRAVEQDSKDVANLDEVERKSDDE